jgi:uncharacterized protein (TIGR03086 family)
MDLTTMQGACASTERIVDGVGAGQLADPTPCSEWDVRALLNHVVGTLHLGAALLSDRRPEVGMGPGGLPATDLVGDEPAKAYRVGVEDLLAAASGDALDRPHSTPLGEVPGAVLGGFTTLDILVHGWDLARATRQDETLPADVAERVLAFAHQTISDETRAPRIGPAVQIGADGSATDRLVAYLGRHP